ncbi:hypothetical protein COO60DRAFT_1645411 [Scenedesmus sp. NREL 46B-D3]|nr:hypothetical protein COO60DRAFT_1645411 [Scenedesmus sp. NREL 46B-D3]
MSIATFRDEWQRQYEPLASERGSSSSSSSSHSRARQLRRQERQRQRHYRSSMFSSTADMYQMVLDMCEEQAESDMVSYSFRRYLSHSLQVATQEQLARLVAAGALAKEALQHVATSSMAEALRLAGNSEFKAGRLQEAMQQYSQAVQLLPSDALLYSNMSLVHVKLGCIDEAWVRFGEACRAARRWQLAQLAYSTAVEELGLTDPAVLELKQECCRHLVRVWRMDQVPSPWQFDTAATWMQLQPKPAVGCQVPAWQDHVEAELERAAASGQVRRLPLKGSSVTLTWLQANVRGGTSGKPWYNILVLPESASRDPELVASMQGEPSTKDLLTTIACHRLEPSRGATPMRPTQVLLAYRTRALFAELHDVLTEQWGIPVTLSELEARRRVQEPETNEQHFLGLCALLAAGAAEADLPLQPAKLLLPGEEQGMTIRRAGTLQRGQRQKVQRQLGQPPDPSQAAAAALNIGTSCSGSGGVDAAWAVLLGVVRGGQVGSQEVDELARRAFQAQSAHV